ncbi:MAG: hypothetical protein RQ783_08830, partial [Gammaproteobacteria bacterium]|nr:hypothetical protein [Gammaproteobacteria bacterium]
MSTTTSAQPKETFLADYQKPAYLVDKIALFFDLDPSHTKVRSVLSMRKNPDSTDSACVLDGEKLELVSVKIDGRE